MTAQKPYDPGTFYRVYDVFTDTAFGGNQLAVFPMAETLPDTLLQSIAREFNFSEVTFVYPPANPANTARVRIFTPTTEVPFAGHPIIGTAVALGQLGRPDDMTLELGIGPIKARVDGLSAQFTTSAPLTILSTPDADLVARALGLDASDLVADPHGPVQASLGLPFVIVALRDRTALSRCRPNTDAIQQGANQHPGAVDFALFAYVRDENTVHARMFAPLENIPEDPATGSAAATLAALLSQIEKRPLSLTIHQGDDMGRPSVIHANVATLAENKLAVTIRGQAIQTMEGHLVL